MSCAVKMSDYGGKVIQIMHFITYRVAVLARFLKKIN